MPDDGTDSTPWPPGAVTGIGSLPGTDPVEAVALVFGELPDLPHLPELPDRGAGAELVGRGAALLLDLPVEIVASGWAFAAHPGRDLRHARDVLARDLDALEERAEGYAGPLKVQVAGPWTLAAQLELRTGHAVISDRGAARDLVASLADGVREHLADLSRRVPGAVPVLQLDEPSLPTALAGHVPTPSGYGSVAALDPAVATQGLADVLGGAGKGCRVVHCCAPDVPIALLRDAGADAIALDRALLRTAHYDELGAAVDAGLSLWLGVMAPGTTWTQGRDAIRGVWRDLGFAAADVARRVVPTPPCGLAGLPEAGVRATLAALRDVGRSLREEDWSVGPGR